jgi:hypothetical protein
MAGLLYGHSVGMFIAWWKLMFFMFRMTFMPQSGASAVALNLLKPTVYPLHQQVYRSRIFLSAYAVFMCFVFI